MTDATHMEMVKMDAMKPEMKAVALDIDPSFEWSSKAIQYQWDSWLYGLVGTEVKCDEKNDAKPKPDTVAVPWGEFTNNAVTYTKQARGALQQGEIKQENEILERQIEVLNHYFHELQGEMTTEWSSAQPKVSNFLMNGEYIQGHMYCEEISLGGMGDERDCWLVVTDKRIIVWRDESCVHETSGAAVLNEEDRTQSACDVPTIPKYVKFPPRTYPMTKKEKFELQDISHKDQFANHLTDMFGKMQCTKLRHSDMFFYSIPVGQIKGVNLDWKTDTLTGHYRVDLNEGEKARILNSCQCHCFICGKDCCAWSCPRCDCLKCNCLKCKPCCTLPERCCHIHPINCYGGCIVKVFRLCCVPCRPLCDNGICRLACCGPCIPSCWRHIDENLIQTCCTNYKVGVLRRMDIFRVNELLGNYKFADGEARFEFQGDQNYGVIDTLKTTKHFIRIEYALLNNGPMQMLKIRAGSKLGANEAIPIIKLCSDLQYKAMAAPAHQAM